MRRRVFLLFLTPAIVVAGQTCTPPAPPIDPAVYRAGVEAWHAERIAGLERPDGWLSLVGLFWLEPGEQTFGAGPGQDLQFPRAAGYASIGTFDLGDSAVTMHIDPGVPVSYAGEPVQQLVLRAETAEFPETEVRLGTLRWHIVRRNGRYAVRLKDSLSAELVAFNGVDRFPVDSAWRLPARFETYDPPKPIKVPNYMGYVSDQTSPGAVVFRVDRTTFRLDVTGEPGDSAFFIPFGDGSNGRDSYGGGRFIWIDGPDASGRTVIDFNRSYNPPCVFSAYATCPLPPRQNRLPVEIPAGERTFHAVSH